MATDFRDGTSFPRPGRRLIGQFMWLARVFDKARADQAGTIHDYIYPCPMDQGVFQRWGISAADFNAAIREHTTDAAIFDWLKARVSDDAREAANAWLVDEKSENLNRQDAEEGAVAR